MQGLTDGISNRFRSRSMLVMGSLKQNNVERTEALSGRLEEILIFEISKDGYALLSTAPFLCADCGFSSTNSCSSFSIFVTRQ